MYSPSASSPSHSSANSSNNTNSYSIDDLTSSWASSLNVQSQAERDLSLFLSNTLLPTTSSYPSQPLPSPSASYAYHPSARIPSGGIGAPPASPNGPSNASAMQMSAWGMGMAMAMSSQAQGAPPNTPQGTPVIGRTTASELPLPATVPLYGSGGGAFAGYGGFAGYGSDGMGLAGVQPAAQSDLDMGMGLSRRSSQRVLVGSRS